MKNLFKKRREPLTDTQLLMTITISIFIVMYILAMAILQGGFLHAQQIFDLLNDNASLIIVSCGLTIVMIGGGIDISVGGVTSLVVMSCILYLNKGGNVFVAALIALVIGLAFGVVHGALISYLEIQPFIVTLAGMFFARGMTTILSVNPQKVDNAAFESLRNTKIEISWLGYVAKNGNLVPARMELGVVIALLCVITVFVILMFNRLGRNFYAMGGNQQSALMLGINVKKTRFMSYLLSGLLSGISGFVLMMHTGAGNATNAAGMEMNAIASSIIGGTLLTGGVGNIIGTFFGTMTLTTIKKIVVSSGLKDPWWQSITTGGMLCFFILLQSIVLSKRQKQK
ncbi:simple sugar transport system permease protein [Butyrivibrio hungatei DSM 14810]|uniref:Simple sugar transport system permease protein n=1 Tax=Butyrivibrio hungatei DSM 14810 TaxID=1121132 RepID=A0A1M7S610_9FIRM|nr:sugar ABC transporter permease YjfF [Butyrivibrio hungatei]SHN53782.1 simple sugar transport system permease protein [Butyrivibrio hungatei DSM 14810]